MTAVPPRRKRRRIQEEVPVPIVGMPVAVEHHVCTLDEEEVGPAIDQEVSFLALSLLLNHLPYLTHTDFLGPFGQLG